MALLEQVRERLQAAAPVLASRVGLIADLSRLTAGDGEKPQVTPAAFVVVLGSDSPGATGASGTHIQMLTTQVGVVIAIDHAGDASGEASMPAIEDLADQVMVAIAGWTPQGATDAFAFRRSRLVGMRDGLVTWQSDFSIIEQLRIP